MIIIVRKDILVEVFFCLQLEEEWNDYREEIKDYTTLKIQNLTTDCASNSSDSNERDNEVQFEENESGEMIPKRKNLGPWKVPEIEPTLLPKGILYIINLLTMFTNVFKTPNFNQIVKLLNSLIRLIIIMFHNFIIFKLLFITNYVFYFNNI